MANSKQYILGLFPDNNNNEISAADMRIFVNAIFDEEIDMVDIIDNLISTNQQAPLSANQGRVLDEKIAQINTDISTKEDSLGSPISDGDVLSSTVSGIRSWVTLPDISQVSVYDGLDSVSTTDALSANIGRILDTKIFNLNQDVVINSANINTNTTDIVEMQDVTIPALDARITYNNGSILTNTANISGNSSSINLIDARVTTLEGDVSTNLANITSNTTNISANSTNISTNTAIITQINTYVGSGSTTDLTSRIDSLESSVAGVDVSLLDGRITQNTNDILQNASLITANSASIQGNADAIVINSGSISSLNSAIATNTQGISNNVNDIAFINNTTIPALDVKLTQNEADILDLDVRVTQNESDIVDLDVKDGTLEVLINTNINGINLNANAIRNNGIDISNNKVDIELLQTEVVAVNNDVINNAVNIENNRQNIVRNGNDVENTDNTVAALTLDVATKESQLGNPNTDGYVLGSLIDGTRVWYPNAFSANDFVVLDNLSSAGDNVNALSANMGYVLDRRILTKEPNLQSPARDGSLLASNSDGTRFWAEPNILDVDYGHFFGFGSTLTSISINPSSFTIDNSEEDGFAQLTAIATYTLSTGGTVSHDVTDQVNWTSSNLSAFTINSGALGGFITPVNGNAIDYSEVATATLDGVQAGANIYIENTSVLLSIVVTPAGISVPVGDTQQMTATGSYSHSGLTQDITNDGNLAWTSDDASVTIESSGDPTPGLATAVATGSAQIEASTENNKGTTITGATSVVVP